MRCHVRLVTFAVLLPVFLVIAATARTQAPRIQKEPATKTCSHADYEMWDELRVLPVRFTDFQDNTAAWKYQDAHIIKVGSFALYESGQYISREAKKVGVDYLMAHKDAGWLCYYCARCQTLLRAYELKAG